MGQFTAYSPELQQRLDLITDAMQPDGFLGEIATRVLAGGTELNTPHDVADVLLPPRGALQPRWELIEGAPDNLKIAYGEAEDRIRTLARHAGLLYESSLPQSQLDKIESAGGLSLVVEGGANRTHVVRRALLDEALATTGRAGVVYEVHGDRTIPRTRGDGTPNPEYTITTGLSALFDPNKDTTEFDAKLLIRLEQGCRVISDTTDESGRSVVLTGIDDSTTVLQLPNIPDEKGIQAGLSAVNQESSLNGTQLVIATNGQYRLKGEMQAQDWATRRGVTLDGIIMLGDEPGYVVNHNGENLVTAKRAAGAYVNEFVVVTRMLQQQHSTE